MNEFVSRLCVEDTGFLRGDFALACTCSQTVNDDGLLQGYIVCKLLNCVLRVFCRVLQFTHCKICVFRMRVYALQDLCV